MEIAVLPFSELCYLEIALLLANQNREIFSRMLLVEIKHFANLTIWLREARYSTSSRLAPTIRSARMAPIEKTSLSQPQNLYKSVSLLCEKKATSKKFLLEFK